MSTDKKTETAPKALGIFPTNISEMKPAEHKAAVWAKDGMAARILAAIRKHGPERANREKLFKEVKSAFPKASEATLKTQIYRGIVHLRGLGELKAPDPAMTKKEAAAKKAAAKTAPKGTNGNGKSPTSPAPASSTPTTPTGEAAKKA